MHPRGYPAPILHRPARAQGTGRWPLVTLVIPPRRVLRRALSGAARTRHRAPGCKQEPAASANPHPAGGGMGGGHDEVSPAPPRITPGADAPARRAARGTGAVPAAPGTRPGWRSAGRRARPGSQAGPRPRRSGRRPSGAARAADRSQTPVRPQPGSCLAACRAERLPSPPPTVSAALCRPQWPLSRAETTLEIS